MPIYEYKCEACEHHEEVFAKMSDPPPAVCEKCGGSELVKVLFPVAVHYKGSGFYKTDYEGTKGAPAAASSSEGSTSSTGEASSSSGSASSSDSAPSTSSSTSDSGSSSSTSASTGSSND
ncbi:MAG: zinc ribbon domain-containing protein [Thermoleophilia bacterium]|nr:zinc ribbon domain-containing protein [Thermoleophilia bacterium]